MASSDLESSSPVVAGGFWSEEDDMVEEGWDNKMDRVGVGGRGSEVDGERW